MEFFHTSVSEESIELVTQVLRSGYLNEGEMVKQLELELRSNGFTNATTTNSCTSALHIALECCNVRGKEVILSPQSFIATGLSVLMAGGIPVFVDVDVNGNIAIDSIEKQINNKTAAVIVVHWGGVPANIHEIVDLCHSCSPKIYVIEDCAHAIGAELDDILLGTTSDFGCFSFQSIKLVTCGDGGFITFNDIKFKDKIQKLKWFGMNKQKMFRNIEGDRGCNIDSLGYKYHMNDIDAAIAIGNLHTLNSRLRTRRFIAEMYNDKIKNKDVTLPNITNNMNPAYWLYTIKVNNRKNFIKRMSYHDIPVSVVDRRIDTNEIFGTVIRNLPKQEYFDEYQISVPIHENLSINDVYNIINVINKD